MTSKNAVFSWSNFLHLQSHDSLYDCPFLHRRALHDALRNLCYRPVNSYQYQAMGRSDYKNPLDVTVIRARYDHDITFLYRCLFVCFTTSHTGPTPVLTKHSQPLVARHPDQAPEGCNLEVTPRVWMERGGIAEETYTSAPPTKPHRQTPRWTLPTKALQADTTIP